MSTWTDGYVSDIQYTAGFYREFTPAHLSLAGTLGGQRTALDPGSVTFCELGCGQGFSTALMAAANPRSRFWGFDFNPAQVANAQRLVAEAGLDNVTFVEESFESLAAAPQDAYPQFDAIALHGVYSWISEANRQAIVRFIGAKLKPGGVLYISYNCMPGWAFMAPMQRLFREHAARNPNRSDRQMQAALDFANRLKDAGSLYFTANPGLAGRLEGLPKLGISYLAHEYLNGHWHPLYHADVAEELAPAKLTFLASATLFENLDNVAVPQSVRDLLGDVSDPVFAQTMRDFAVNRQFRRDVFARGATPFTNVERAQVWRDTAIALTIPRADATLTVNTGLQEATCAPGVYTPILDALAEGPRTVGELAALPALRGQTLAAVFQAAVVLVASGQAQPVLPGMAGRAADRESGAAARALNAAVARHAALGGTLSYLAAPVTGSAILVSTVELLAYGLLSEQGNVPVDVLVAEIRRMLLESGRALSKDGKPLTVEAEALAELRAQIGILLDRKLPLWRQLGVI